MNIDQVMTLSETNAMVNNLTDEVDAVVLEMSGIIYRNVQFICKRDYVDDIAISLHVEGIQIAAFLLQGPLKEGEIRNVPVLKFPYVNLPTTIRCKSNPRIISSDVGLVVKSEHDVYALVGKGDIRVVNTRFESGSVIIEIINDQNGAWHPDITARINNGLTRGATVEKVSHRDQGGCFVQCRIQLHSTDIRENGLLIEFIANDREGVIKRLEFHPFETEPSVAAVHRIERELRSFQAVQQMRVSTMERKFQRHAEAISNRLEAFIEHLQAAVDDNEFKARIGSVSFLSKCDHLEPVTEPAELVPDNKSVLMDGVSILHPESDCFKEGWHQVELDASGKPFRWMDIEATIELTSGTNAVQSMVFHVERFYGSKQPNIMALIDGRSADINIKSSNRPGMYEVRVTPNFAAIDITKLYTTVLLRSETWGSPKEDEEGEDQRHLSLMIREVEVFVEPQSI